MELWLGIDYMKDMIEKKRVRIKYRYAPDAEQLLFTASSTDLAEMIERYSNEKRLKDWKDQPAMLILFNSPPTTAIKFVLQIHESLFEIQKIHAYL